MSNQNNQANNQANNQGNQVIRTGIQNLFSVGSNFGYNRPTILDNSPNVEEALKLSGLDWEVEIGEVKVHRKNGDCLEAENKKALINPVTGEILSIMSGKYSVCENRDAFGFVEGIEGGKIVAGGQFNGGGVVWLIIQIDQLDVRGDKVEGNIMVLNSHNGTKQVTILPCPVRIHCTNVFPMMLKNCKSQLKIRHSGQIEYKLEEAKNALGFTAEYYGEMNKEIELLQSTFLSKDEAAKMVNYILKIEKEGDKQGRGQTRKENVKDIVMGLFSRGMGNEGKSGWDLVNAFSEYGTHFSGTKNKEIVNPITQRFSNLTLGMEKSLTQQANELIHVFRANGAIPEYKKEKSDFLF